MGLIKLKKHKYLSKIKGGIFGALIFSTHLAGKRSTLRIGHLIGLGTYQQAVIYDNQVPLLWI